MEYMNKDKFKTITVVVDIHADGDVYVQKDDGSFQLIGQLCERDFGEVPNTQYKLAKKHGKLLT